ncbi:DUF1028 domain-containing protein [Acuticoccus sediminis]|uniref:DUF1028 domain-containing protein n=1 Tax=Acuticoccus sediminis TaxID=2184697 RepID=A0A8B2NRJ7_9HYPH|nr:DUF1028 domain-containing protein [Acuticoccus sediminis]RAI01521.1 DUF1028 domain-containing protein [Acuticoccus sediminis]
MTYSIAARCPRTGQFGLAVTTSSIAVGPRCAFARPGIGAVLTQHQTDPRLGPMGLALLEEGLPAAEVIERLTTSGDPHIQRRQLAVVDRNGQTGVFHGDKIWSVHGEARTDGAIAIANIVRNADVPAAMIAAFDERPEEPLAERLVAALEAGKAAGGEWKQEKSAALLVVEAETFPLVDLRVDYDPRAIDQLRFLWDTYRPMVEMYVARALAPDTPPAGFTPPPGSAPKPTPAPTPAT